MAAELIPAERLADWTPGVTVGVPGGIPTNRTHLIDVTKAPYNADNTGTTDAQPAIMQAMAEAKPRRTWCICRPGRTGSTRRSHIGSKSKITIRGAGPEKTFIMLQPQCNGAIALAAAARTGGMRTG